MASSLGARILVSIKRQPQKYSKLGYGKYFALLTWCLYFTVQLQLLKLIWPFIHGRIPDLPLYIIIIVVTNFLVVTVYNVLMYFVYVNKIPFFEQFRTDKNSLWPWESNPKEWNSVLIKSIKVNFVNIVFYSPLVAIPDALIEFNFKMDLQSVPSVTTMLWQIVVFILAAELSFYFIHKILHYPRWYWLHKQHHQYNISTALAVLYAHPVEHMLANIIPAGLGYKLLSKFYPVHIFTIIIWIVFRLLQTCDGHSGYDWPWAQSQLLPFSAGGPYHYFHHKQNSGNFGSILHIFDTIFNTNEDFHKYQQIQAKKKK